MKRFSLVMCLLGFLLCSCAKDYTDEINNLKDQINQLADTRVASVEQQITSIKSSITSLQAVDTQLQGYITALQTQATTLSEAISLTDNKIDKVKLDLQSDISLAKADVIAQLEAYKTIVNNQLSAINSTIATLQAKDEELQTKMDNLKTYVDVGIQGTKDWVATTYATLEQQESISTDVANIKEQIITLNSYLTDINALVKEQVDYNTPVILDQRFS